MNNKQSLGKLGETIAVNYLISKQYTIIDQNYRCKFGEIDIICIQNDTLVFIEVKTRQSTFYGYPIEAITKIKQKHIYNTASNYLLTQDHIYSPFIRIDAIEVYINWPNITVNHVKGIITNQIK